MMRGLHLVGDVGGCVLHAGTVALERDDGDAAGINPAVWVKLTLLLPYRL